ncbi:hypothetical protein NPX13_g8985 [Xylaria arbuscula]|uniref:Class II aldolase/adducin N-terminal domain-containing protein n=1 Tax=Xylaria arbuscula TaxID=114810 RepID=A0A9W8N7V1_9PEZI|nr:hypothetical protein NPX13_g8985 [Xylaria arbuscula]
MAPSATTHVAQDTMTLKGEKKPEDGIGKATPEEQTPLEAISHGMVMPGIPSFPTFGAERRHMLTHMAATFRFFARSGFTEGQSGHISVRDPEHPGLMWMNPLGRHFGMLTAGDMICLEIETGRVAGGNTSRPANAAGYLIHSAVHKRRPNDGTLNLISHPIPERVLLAYQSIPSYLFASSRIGVSVPIGFRAVVRSAEVLSTNAPRYLIIIPYPPSPTGYVQTDIRRRVQFPQCARCLRALRWHRVRGGGRRAHRGRLGTNNKGVILMNHGLLTVGATVDEAGFMFGLMERACAMQLQVEAAAANGLPKCIISDEEAAYNFKMASEKHVLYREAQPDLEFEFEMAGGEDVVARGFETLRPLEA